MLPVDPRRRYPLCTGGKRASPQEDGGGGHGRICRWSIATMSRWRRWPLWPWFSTAC
jgi:hypothetical protein